MPMIRQCQEQLLTQADIQNRCTLAVLCAQRQILRLALLMKRATTR
jgi:hypothetical protein